MLYITRFEFKSRNSYSQQLFLHLLYAPTFPSLPECKLIHLAFMSLMFMFVTIQMLAFLTGIFQYFH